MRRTRLVALLVAAVLGAGGGAATALLTDDGSATAPYADPLGLGIPLENLDCTGRPAQVVGYGDNAAALRNEVVNTPGDLSYLETRRSCATRWTPSASTAEPDWVVYRLGDPEDLCLDRLDDEAYRNDNVTFLVDGIGERAMCLCEVPASAAPDLRAGTAAARAPRNRVWIGELQDMLMTIDDELRTKAKVRLTADNRTPGRYERVMADRIDVVREELDLEPDGVLDARVWQRITATGCPLYDYR